MIATLAVQGYRSLRDLRLSLGQVTIVTGANGSGKSNLYKSLRLLADVAQGRVAQTLAAEGGLSSTLWAGPETIARSVRQGRYPVQGTARKGPVSLRMGFAADNYGYAIDLGLPPPPPSIFSRDPEIKLESLWHGPRLTRHSCIARRVGPHVAIKDEAGRWSDVMTSLAPVDSMMTHCADPKFGFELLLLREKMRAWRFYDHFRSDREAPSRRPQVGTFTPILADDGADLAAAVATIQEIGDYAALDAAIQDAFPGSSLSVSVNDGYFELLMAQHGLLRPLRVAELSDGTLRYLLWVAALLSPRPPDLIVLNEPETSLHIDLLEPLARLVLRAAERSQVILISHDPVLQAALRSERGVKHIALSKDFGETQADDEYVSWNWPER